MSLISPEYKTLQQQFHEQRPDYGTSSMRHIENILSLSTNLKTRSILDYGCGKAALQKGLHFPIQNYDPAMPEYATPPTPADIVVCTDVLEHIEANCLKEVMDDLARLTRVMLFLNVSCRPASKTLPDGRNAHLIVQSPNWWLSWILPRFNLQAFQCDKSDFNAICLPLAAPAQEKTNAT